MELLNVFITFDAVISASIACFWAIVFLQSGLDKVFDFKGNVEWLKGHFEKSFLGRFTTLLVITLTIFELIAGLTSLIGLIDFLISGSKAFIAVGIFFSIISLLMLIFGQRIAKDYDGAKTIAIYFGIALLSAYILN